PRSRAPVCRGVGVPEALESQDEPTVVVPFESVFTPTLRKPSPAVHPEPPTGPLVRAVAAPAPPVRPGAPVHRAPPVHPAPPVRPAPPAASAPPTTPIPSLSK